MDCPNCGTYNPDDRDKCWRCNEPLPTVEPEKRANPQQKARTWLYVGVAVFLVATILQMCGVPVPGLPQNEGQLRRGPAIAIHVGESSLGL